MPKLEQQKFRPDRDYSGKWCLFRNGEHDMYTSIYVIGCEDGIVKYVFENDIGTIRYENDDYFADCAVFMVNPIMALPPSSLRKGGDVAEGVGVPTKTESRDGNANAIDECKMFMVDKSERYMHVDGDSLVYTKRCPYSWTADKYNFHECDAYRNGYCSAEAFMRRPPMYSRCFFEHDRTPRYEDCDKVNETPHERSE